MRKPGGKGIADLSRQIVMSRACGATNDRDRIYGLLGFAVLGSDCNGADQLLKVDYKMSIEEVFVETTRLVLDHAEDLAFLSTITEEGQGRNMRLPSWVPDFSLPGSHPSPLYGYGLMTGDRRNENFFSAAGQLSQRRHSPLSDDNQNILKLDGYIFDTIEATGESYDERVKNAPHSFLGMLTLVSSLNPIYHTGETRSDVFWRTMIADQKDDHHPAPSSLSVPFKKLIFRWLIQLAGSHLQPDSTLPEQYIKKSFKNHSALVSQLDLKLSEPEYRDFVRLHETPLELAGHLGNGHDYLVCFNQVYAWRRLFRTQKGYLGVGPQSLEVGDVVVVLPGAGVPFVLRTAGDGRWRLIGEGYVHGIMHGEALEMEGLKEMALV